ncbi:MAG: type I-B CRISPR-associated endonuclease Cas1 [Chloroflexi bacterium]|nr:type I-B CRISPR-associated endonuclease Cas1 [Chloroflexota bacterium]
MAKPIYIFSNGELSRRDNTIWLNREDGTRQAIPVEAITDLHAFGEVKVNKRFLEFLTASGIALHFFNHYGYYDGSYYPRTRLNSGYMILRQAEHYLDERKRIFLARSFVQASIQNALRNLQYYRRRGRDLDAEIAELDGYLEGMKEAKDIAALMGYEGRSRTVYYATFNKIVEAEGFAFTAREIRPPSNPINALISFGNSLLYVAALSEIYRTQLDPRIGYLHSSNERSFSLNLDIADVFKPILVDRVIFSVINKRQISEKDFAEEMGGVYLNDRGRQEFLKAFEEKLQESYRHRGLQRSVSYRYSLRLECYKLYRHFIGEEEYRGFVSDW